MGVTASTKVSIVCFIAFYPTKTRLEGRNCYADKLLFSNCVVVIFILNTLADNEMGTSCVCRR